MIEFDALATCFSSAACLVNQVSSGLIIGMLLFLVASGVTLIFGVLHVINFAHGSFYMLGAYFAYTVYAGTESFFLAAVAGAVGAGIAGIIFERLLMSRVYGQDILMQLLVCYAVILIVDDLVKIIWGAEYLAMGVPDEFRVPPWRVAGGFIPPFYLFLVGASVAIGIGTLILVTRTRFGRIVRAAAHNPSMVSALGIRVPLYFALLFGLGWGVAGACPGTVLVMLGEGKLGALFTIAGITAGTYLYGAVHTRKGDPAVGAPQAQSTPRHSG